jgi:hypothetical protein
MVAREVEVHIPVAQTLYLVQEQRAKVTPAVPAMLVPLVTMAAEVEEPPLLEVAQAARE